MKQIVALVLLSIISTTLATLSCSIWPAPAAVIQGTTAVGLEKTNFKFEIVAGDCPIIRQAVDRYVGYIFKKEHFAKSNTMVTVVSINILHKEEKITIGTNETYSLQVHEDGQASIVAENVFGALRALETFYQLVVYQNDAYIIPCTPILLTDFPSYPHRGLMIDTSRHFMPISFIYKIVDAISFSKMSVLHWHIVDAETFPINVPSYPELSKATYCDDCIFDLGDIRALSEYALYRGVRIIIEIDTPGHAHSWGVGYPNLVVNCPSYAANIDNIPLNPTINATYDAVDAVIRTVIDASYDAYVHLGGDEVVYGCWNESEQVMSFMKEHKLTFDGLMKYYIEKVHKNTISKLDLTSIFWQEAFLAGALSNLQKSVVHVWKDPQRTVIKQAMDAGMHVLLSDGWYLTRGGTYGDTWEDMYTNDVPDSPLVLGGEACTWNNHADMLNHFAVSWPRAAAVGERLWSHGPFSTTEAGPRLDAFRCRLVQRGINASPIFPGYCDGV